MRQKLEEIKNSAINELKTSLSKDELESIRVKYLGKKGELTQILRGMGSLSQEERPVVGKVANEIRSYIEETIKNAFSDIKNKEKSMRLENETIDVTMPGKKQVVGKRHPLDLTLESMKDIFISMGFTIEEGPEVELDKYNFEALNYLKTIQQEVNKILFI
jgi:phenylalanyl-tRNA synthetase alpha chain